MPDLLPRSLMDRMPVIKVSDYVSADENAVQTAQIQAAINAQIGTNDRYATRKLVYFAPRQYLIDDTLKSRVNDPFSDGWRAGLGIFGINKEETIFKLIPNAPLFQDLEEARAMFMFGSEDSTKTTGQNEYGFGNQAFQHEIRNVTIDLNGNAAVGVDWYAHNRGCLSELLIISSSTSTGIGIFSTRSNNGPNLIQDVEVQGCLKAFWQLGYTYSLTLSRFTARGQGEVAIEVDNANIQIENLKSYNNKLAVRQTENNGFISLINPELRLNNGQLRDAPIGIDASGRVEIQNLKSDAYTNPVRNTRDGTVTIAETSLPLVEGLRTLDRFTTFENKNLFPSEPRPLTSKQAPDFWSDLVEDCAVLSDYFEEGDTTDQTLQRAIDSGKKIVMLDTNQIYLEGVVYIRGSVQKIIGFQCQIVQDLTEVPADIYFDGTVDCTLENLWLDVPVVHRSDSALHVKFGYLHTGDYSNTPAGTGDLFISDVVTKPIVARYGQHVYCRQINNEFSPISIDLYDAYAWILGFKTERSTEQGEINLRATNSEVQLIGGVWYPLGSVNNSNPQTPAIELINCENALLSWNNFGPELYNLQVRETIDSTTLEFLATPQNLSYDSPTCVSYSGGRQLNSVPEPSPDPTPSGSIANIKANRLNILVFCGVQTYRLIGVLLSGETDGRSTFTSANTDRIFFVNNLGQTLTFVPGNQFSPLKTLLPGRGYAIKGKQNFSFSLVMPADDTSKRSAFLASVQQILSS